MLEKETVSINEQMIVLCSKFEPCGLFFREDLPIALF